MSYLGGNPDLSFILIILSSYESMYSWVYVSIAVYFKEKVLWLKMRIAFVYGYKSKYLDCSLVPCKYT